MTSITLDTPVVIVPAQEAKTSSAFTVSYIEENYGNDGEHGPRSPGRPSTVVATVVLSNDPYMERHITVWEGADYLAVRGTWTDQDLYTKIKQILEAGN
jgi:hypothetical protein